MRVLSVSIISIIYLLSQSSSAYHIFNSRESTVRLIIDECRANDPNEHHACYSILRCILTNTPNEITARWSAGASILAFIPTVVALMSNSVNEISAVADESMLLSILLSTSSITAFISRFGDMPMRSSETFFHEHGRHDEFVRNAWSMIEALMTRREQQDHTSWWRGRKMQSYILCIVLLILSLGIWYEVYETAKYGIVVNACPIKMNVGLWVGLSQLLALLNVAFRHRLLDIHTISLSPQILPSRGLESRKLSRALLKPTEPFKIVLRSPRTSTLRWILQTATAVASFTLYTYGTVILASTTLIPASDAIRAMVVLAASAGFGRLVGYWAALPSRTGSRRIVVSVPAEYLEDFHKLVLEKAGAHV